MNVVKNGEEPRENYEAARKTWKGRGKRATENSPNFEELREELQ